MLIKALLGSLLFKDFKEEEIDRLLESSQARLLDYEKDSYLFHQASQPQAMFILISGSVQLERLDVNGKRNLVNIFKEPGSIFGEVYLYLREHTYDYSCVAREKTQVLALDRDFFKASERLGSRLMENMLELVSEKAFQLNQKLLIMASFSLRQKIGHYLTQRVDLDQRVDLNYNREELADYMGVARPSLSRELSLMEKEGLIRLDKNSIQILDLKGLGEIL